MKPTKDRQMASAPNRSFFPVKYGLLVLAVAIVAFVWYATRLVISLNPEGDRQPVTFNTSVGDVWNIRFTHSVEKTPVEEFFTVNGAGDLVMTHTRFESFGWGFPYSPADGKITPTDDGRFDLVMNRPYKTVKMRVAVQAKPCIIHNSTVYDLCDLFGQGTLVEVKAEYRYQYWLAHYFN